MFSVLVGILLLVVGGLELFGPGWQVLGKQTLVAALDPNVRWMAAVASTLIGFALIVNAWRIHLDEEVNSWTPMEPTSENEEEISSRLLPSLYRIGLSILFLCVGAFGLYNPAVLPFSSPDNAAQSLPGDNNGVFFALSFAVVLTGVGLLFNGLRTLFGRGASSSSYTTANEEHDQISFLMAMFGTLRFGAGFLFLALACLQLFGASWSSLVSEAMSSQIYRAASWTFALSLSMGGFFLIVSSWDISFFRLQKGQGRSFDLGNEAEGPAEIEVSRETTSSGLFRSVLGFCLLEFGCLDLFGPGWPNVFPQTTTLNLYYGTASLFAVILALIGFNFVLTAWQSSQSSSSRRRYDFEVLDPNAARLSAQFTMTLRISSGLLLIVVGCLELFRPGWGALLPDLFAQFLKIFPIATGSAAACVLAGLALMINALRLMGLLPEKEPTALEWNLRPQRVDVTGDEFENSYSQVGEKTGGIGAGIGDLAGAALANLSKKFRANDNDMRGVGAGNEGEISSAFEEGFSKARVEIGQGIRKSGASMKKIGHGALGVTQTGLFHLVGFVRGLLEKRQQRMQSEKSGGEAPPQQSGKSGSELTQTFTRCKGAFLAVGIFSAFSNILTLTGSFYMLEVYDRVVPSRSVPTLVVLSVVALLLMAIQGGLDFIRSRILIRASNFFEDRLGQRVFDITTRVATTLGRRGNGLQPIRDLDAIKAFLSSGGPGALMDLPWLPFYMAIIFMFHWVLGVTALIGALILVGLTVVTELKSHKPIKQTNERVAERSELAMAGRRNAEVLASLGMKGRLSERYRRSGVKLAEFQTRSSDVSGGLGSVSKTLRMVLQSAMLGIGALLVIAGEASSGIIIAGSILSGRALAPVDQAIANWKLFVTARQGWKRLSDAFEKLPPEPQRMSLPKPKDTLRVENLLVLEPGGQRPIIRDINFELKAGQSLCIIGPSGSGKSTLARSLVKAWMPAAGRVRIDGASLDQWPTDELGAHLGYLPQDVELFSGTIADNIARLADKIESEPVIAAAQAAGAHQLILTFKDGYQTEIGEGGAVLSAGQRQRVALARALYKDPFLVVLDEPNSNLDAEGDKALLGAIEGVKKRNGIIIVISHRPSVLQAFDLVMIMTEGRVAAFGPRDEVLAKYAAAGAGRPPGAAGVPGQGLVPTQGGPSPAKQGPMPASGRPSAVGPVVAAGPVQGSGSGGVTPLKPQLIKAPSLTTVGEGE